MSYETIDPAEAQRRMEAEGWQYLDVRTVEEFAAGHPSGAFNVPLAMHDPMGGMNANPEFLDVVSKSFEKDTKLVVGCKMGGRSMNACEFLSQYGFTALANMHGGYSGAPDMEGWESRGLPVDAQPKEGRDYDSLRG